MKQLQPTILDKYFSYSFLEEWQPFDEINKKVERAILNHFMRFKYKWQPDHNPKSKIEFNPITFEQINRTLGLAYTSSSSYAALWVCGSGYLWADKTHYFNAFAVTLRGTIVAIAIDEKENEIYIPLN